MHNVVPFPKSASKRTVEVAHHIRHAILLLDLSLHQTQNLVSTFPTSSKTVDLEQKLRELGIVLEMLRDSAQMFPSVDRHCD
jgi:hypothetical protein